MLFPPQVSIHIDKMFRGSLKHKNVRKLYEIRDIFQMRSNCVNWRTCPTALFVLEGISKIATLAIIGVIAIMLYDNDVYSNETIMAAENYLMVSTLAALLHELGEIQTMQLSTYFNVRTNFHSLDNLY